MRVMTFNANGLRSAARKGFFDWFARQRVDVLCVQELKAQVAQLDGRPFERRGFHRHIVDAQRPGYTPGQRILPSGDDPSTAKAFRPNRWSNRPAIP